MENMKRLLLFLFSLTLFYACGGGFNLSTEDMLELSGTKMLPIAAQYQEDGAVVLYENIETKLYLDGDYNPYIEKTVHRSVIYFNDNAEAWTSQSIYLDPDRELMEFSARTIKPNGEVIEVKMEDLHRTKLTASFIEFSDDESKKFKFPGVEEGAILEFKYKVNIHSFLGGDTWLIQQSIPKLYSRYSVEIPRIFFRYKYNWTYAERNIKVGEPQKEKVLINADSNKDRSLKFFWEVKNIDSYTYEPTMPPYDDVGKYVKVDIRREDWNELSSQYWEQIKTKFNAHENAEIKALAAKITKGAQTDREKLEKIYAYTQQNYRYVAIDIGQSGYIPNSAKSIIKNKYGDCKDMTVLNTALLKAVGIKSYPALVKTKSEGMLDRGIISRDFNHMINYVELSDGKTFWLDATGSSCPLDDVYAGIEGVDALVILEDGKSKFVRVPKSKYSDNKLVRNVELTLNRDGTVTGVAKLKFTGNENISFRSSFKDETAENIYSAIEGYINRNLSDVKIDSLIYEDPSIIKESYEMEVRFTRSRLGSKAGDLLIFKPSVFQVEDRLDKYKDIDRKHTIVYSAPYELKDVVIINYDSEKYGVESIGNNHSFKMDELSYTAIPFLEEPGKIKYSRSFKLKRERIIRSKYSQFRTLHKTIAKANEENIVLKKK